MKQFKFEIGDWLAIDCSGESGTCIGRGELLDSSDIYLIRYKAGDGRAVEKWWDESALTIIK